MSTRARHSRVTLSRQLFGLRSFVVVYFAEAQSTIGDQLARFALSVLVFDRTGSATAAALTYAVSFLPAILGGALLGRLGDRFPGRRVMVAADLFRAATFAAMSIPGLPIGVIVGLLAVAVFAGPAFTASEVNFLAGLLDAELFRVATAVRSATSQLAQVLGFAVGGAIVLFLHPRGALLVNAATFVISALLITIGIVGRSGVPAPSSQADEPADKPADKTAFAGLWRDLSTRGYMSLFVVMGLFVVPESLAVPFGHQIGASTVQTGILVATIPLGSAIGAVLVVRIPAGLRSRAAGAMAVLCGLPLIASLASPTWLISCVCWLVSGLLGAYQVEVISGLVRAIPEQLRSTALGHLGAWLLGAQGLAFAAGGLLAQSMSSGAAIALTAATGSALALLACGASVRRFRLGQAVAAQT